MAIKKSQLYSTLWESCNALRGSMDASQYKDYVLMILFVKFLSDKAKQGQSKYLKIPAGCSFEDFSKLKQNDHIGEEINKKLEKIKEENAVFLGSLSLPNFNDPTKLGETKAMKDTLSKLIAVFENDDLDFSKNRAADDDLLGDAYEYLMKNFAAESGKSKGQFYTPAEVSRVIAKVLHLGEFTKASNSIYDPTCGSGSLLLRALAETPDYNLSIRGQEKDSTTASLAKLNMLLHGIVSSKIEVGDTLNNPKFTSGQMLQTFDVCVANPPFSQKNWLSEDTGEKDKYGRWTETLLAPTSCGDFAFLQHLIASMNVDTGRGACILPHGVLFRGNAEYAIRKDIVDRHLIKGIISLPPNLFFGTGIPASIIIIDKKDASSRTGIFFIDAKDGFVKDGAKNRLREQDIKKIVDTWNEQKDVPHYARLVSWAEITDSKNDYNLNIPRYITAKDKEIQQDIYAHLNGGIPKHDIEQMDYVWRLCPDLKKSLLKEKGDGYYEIIPDSEKINEVIFENASFKKQQKEFKAAIKEWENLEKDNMLSISQKCNPKKLILKWSEDLLGTFKKKKSLVDSYEIYEDLMNYWAQTMQDDCYIVSSDGWKAELVPPAKKKFAFDEYTCDLLPVSIVLDEYFKTEKDNVYALRAKIEDLQNQADSIVEDNAADFDDSQFECGFSTKSVRARLKAALVKPVEKDEPKVLKKALELFEKKGKEAKAELSNYVEKHKELFAQFEKVGKKAVGGRLKEIASYKPALHETIKIWEEYVRLIDEKAVATEEKNEAEKKLRAELEQKYKSLTEDEIKILVVTRKWFGAFDEKFLQELTKVTQKITSEIDGLATRYENTLSELETEVQELESKVSAHLKEMGF